MTTTRTTTTPPAKCPDEDLEHRVRLYLSATRTELSRLFVWADAGTVRLVGPVSSFYTRQLALSAASRVAGVRQIIDEIEVLISSADNTCRKPR